MINFSSVRTFVVMTCAGILLAACAGSSVSTVGTSSGQSSQFNPDPNFAKVFFYRDNAAGASLSTDYIIGERPVSVQEDGKAMEVRVNSERAGYTTIRTYFRFDFPAGHYVFTSQGRRTKLVLDVENGSVYYIQQKDDVTRMGAGSRLTLVSEKKGRKGVTLARYLPSNIERVLAVKNAAARAKPEA